MELPNIVLPSIELPFTIEALLHPLVVHFMIAFPVMVLFLEIMNILMNKKIISGVNTFLLLLTIIVSVGVYFTGLVDGKEAFSLLTDEAKEILAEHKLLGIYLILGTVLVFVLKLFSLITGNFFKVIYIFALFVLVGGLLTQGRQGGKLVYTHGANVMKIKVLDDKVFDLEDSQEDLIFQNKSLSKELEILHKDKAEALQRVKILQGNIKILEEINISKESNITL